MSLHKFAEQVAAQGRGDDSLLVHMTPDEVQRLQAFAEANGRTMTINPETGLPEAGFLSDLFKAVAPIALGAFLGPAGAAIGGGFMSAGMAGLTVGGLTTLATGSLSRGLMAGMGAYGGAGLGESLMNAGTGGLAATDIAAQQAAGGFPTLAEGATQEQIAKYATDVGALRDTALSKAGGASLSAKASAGLGAIAQNPGAYGSDLFKYGSAAATPILAGAMVPTTTSMPSSAGTGFIRQKIVNPDGTVRDLTPVKASEWGSRNFSDVYRGYKGGGIVALAAGGTPPAINSVEDLYTNILGRAPDAGGLAYWQQGFGDTIDANEIASFKQAAQAELNNRSAAEQQILAPNLVNTAGAAAPAATSVADLYQGILGRAPESADVTNYWQNQFGNTIDANELAQFKTAAQAELDARKAGTTGGGVANLATTGAGTTAGGITNLTGGTTGGTSLADAQAQVNNMYRNVLGRDADPTGLAFWSNAIASGRSGESVYQDFLASARANTELVTADQIKNKTFAEATTPYTGYMSSEGSNIVDEWVRNTLGREPTAADRQQQWYKDAADKMTTQGQAQDLYSQFKTYATKESSTEIANRVRAIDAELKAKGLTDADLLKQTGKTKQQLATEGLNLDLNWMGASQLAPAAKRTGFDLTAVKNLTPLSNTFGGSAIDRTITNPYGNATNPGDLTYNRDGTVTVTPNIPYRPYGGFSGTGEVKNAYTQGGGSLGHTAKAPKTMEEFNQLYNKQTGDSLAAYNYLMGKGAYPTKSGVGEISRPYREATLGYPESTNKMYNWDPVAGKMVRNPDYVAPGRDADGNVTYGMSLNDIKKSLTDAPLQGQALFDWAQTNNLSAQDIADATGMKLSDVYAQFREGAQAAAKKKKDAAAAGSTAATDVSGGGDSGDSSDSSDSSDSGGNGSGAASGDCVDPNVHILLADGGTVRAGDLKVGDMLYTLHDTTFVYGNYPVEYLNILQRPKVEALFDDGQKIIISITHKFLTADGQWEKISDMEVGTAIRGIGDVTKKLVSTTDMGVGPVVEMVVTEAHTYISEGLASHNKYYGGLVNGKAAGGMTGYAIGGGLGSLGAYSDGGRLLKGPGDGVSDSIPATIGAKQQPARLADGEFVIPARIVSELGNGSTDAGAKKLYAMMDRVQKARGKTTGKNKVAANSRADKHLPA